MERLIVKLEPKRELMTEGVTELRLVEGACKAELGVDVPTATGRLLGSVPLRIVSSKVMVQRARTGLPRLIDSPGLQIGISRKQ